VASLSAGVLLRNPLRHLSPRLQLPATTSASKVASALLHNLSYLLRPNQAQLVSGLPLLLQAARFLCRILHPRFLAHLTCPRWAQIISPTILRSQLQLTTPIHHLIRRCLCSPRTSSGRVTYDARDTLCPPPGRAEVRRLT